MRHLGLRVLAAPFQAAIAVIIIVQAITALGGWGLINPIDALLPGWLAIAFSAAYLLAGLCWLAGLLLPRGDVEGFGLWLLGGTVIARGLMFGVLLGWRVESITSLAFSLCLASACAARIWVLWRLNSAPREPAG